MVALPAVRHCRLCAVTKPLVEFSFLWKNESNGASYYRRECKACRKEVARRPDQQVKSISRRQKWRAKNPEKHWLSHTAYRFRKEYGITIEEAFALLAAQDGRCANTACGVQIEFGGRIKKVAAAVIDHCHQTGKVRGILCDSCNKTIGLGRENEKILQGLVSYLESFIAEKKA